MPKHPSSLPSLFRACMALALALNACGGERESPSKPAEALGASSQALTQSQREILGFERLDAWTLSQGTKSLSSVHTEGNHAFALDVANWVTLESVPLGTLSETPEAFYLDFRTPAPPTTSYWLGAVHMHVTIESQNIHNEYLGQNELTGKPVATFVPLAFQLPTRVKDALKAHPSDVRLKVALNVPAGNATYLLDALRFQPGQTPPTDGGGERASCNRYAGVGLDGSVRYELSTPPNASQVTLQVKRGTAVILYQRFAAPKATLPNGNAYYSLIHTGPYASGDELDVIFSYVKNTVRVEKTSKLTYGTFQDCVPVLDRDLDDVPDALDECPDDPEKSKLGLCPCNVSELDTDGDGTPDCIDECDTDRTHTKAGACGCATRPAPVGKACSDAALPGTFTCNGAGVCGNLEDARPTWTHGKLTYVELDRSGYLITVQDKIGWDEAQRLAPPGYRLLRIDERRENSQIKAVLTAANVTDVWLDAKLIGTGLIAHVDRQGGTDAFWDESRSPKNVDRAFNGWAEGQPPVKTNTGCVVLATDGTWRVTGCGESHHVVYERITGQLSVHTGMSPIACSDFPGLVCAPNGVPGSEPCSPTTADELECQGCSNGDVGCPDKCAQLACTECLEGVEGDSSPDACASQCPNLACDKCRAENEDDPAVCAAQCPADPGIGPCRTPFSERCGVVPAAPAVSCTSSASCSAGQVCGPVVSDACRTCLAKVPSESCGSVCDAARFCGSPARCGQGLSDDDAEGGACTEVLSCADAGAEGHPDPDGLGLVALAEPDAVEPSAKLPAATVAIKTQFPEEKRTQAPPPGQPDPWCKYDNAPKMARDMNDTRSGSAGSGKALQFDIDPHVRLDYVLDPLPFGQFKFDVTAEARLTADAHFDIAGVNKKVPIVHALMKAHGSRCGFESDVRLDLFGQDFLPDLLSPAALAALRANRTIKGCEEALAAYQEVADRAKKAMHDAKELLRQYHEGLASGTCLNGQAICDQLLKNAPAGFPVLTCNADVAVEDVINLFIFYYHTQLSSQVSLPSWPDSNIPKLANAFPSFPDVRLKKPTFGNLTASGDFGFNGDWSSMNPLPSLGDASAALSEFKLDRPSSAPEGPEPDWVDQYGCGASAKTERQTVAEKVFMLGPIPMLLQVESVVRYGIDGRLDFDFRPDELARLAIDPKGSKATIASVTASARPCVSAGLGMFVGAGFKAYGFRATAGVEGLINLGTLSAPASATAAIQVSAQEERVSLEPQADAVIGKDPPAVRELPDDLKALWEGPELPVKPRRLRVDLAYNYGLAVKADEILAGHLKASLQIKFWRWRKRWSKYLVDFGNGISLGERRLLGGSGEATLLSGVPWGTLQVPSPFVSFRYLNRLPQGLIGATPRQISDRLPNLKVSVAKLGNLGWSIDQLSSVPLSLGDLASLGKRLGYRDLLGELQLKGVDITRLKLSDLALLDFDLGSLHSAPLEAGDLQALNLSLDQLAALGIDLPTLAPDRLDLTGVSVGHLAKLALPKERLSQLRIDWPELALLSFLLDRPELESELLAASVNLVDLRLTDFDKLGIQVPRFRGFPLTPFHVQDLALTPAELRLLGVDLSGITLDMDGSADVLYQRGLDLSGLSLADLSQVGFTLSGLGAIQLDLPRFLEISTALGVPDIQAALRAAGVDPSQATLAELSKIGVELPDIQGVSLDLSSLDLDASEIIKVGYGKELEKITDLALTCPKVDVKNDVIGEFFYDHHCQCQAAFDGTKPFELGEQSCSNDADCCDGLRCLESTQAKMRVCGTCPGGGTTCEQVEEIVETEIADECRCLNYVAGCGDGCPRMTSSKILQSDIVKDFGGQLPITNYRVYLVNAGTGPAYFDDQGFAVEAGSPTSSAGLPVSTGEICVSGQVGMLLGPIDITSKVTRKSPTSLAFALRSQDICGTAVGWGNVKVRWVLTRGVSLP